MYLLYLPILYLRYSPTLGIWVIPWHVPTIQYSSLLPYGWAPRTNSTTLTCSRARGLDFTLEEALARETHYSPMMWVMAINIFSPESCMTVRVILFQDWNCCKSEKWNWCQNLACHPVRSLWWDGIVLGKFFPLAVLVLKSLKRRTQWCSIVGLCTIYGSWDT